ncbi:MAG: hypothetical protein GY719_31265 [bacterium]|nr:hypothetical protein [bacterium]
MPTDEEVAQVAGYDKLLLLKAIDSEFLRGERITDVVTWHDESCASVLHDGICNCSPEATLTGRMGRYFVRKDGTVEPLDPN